MAFSGIHCVGKMVGHRSSGGANETSHYSASAGQIPIGVQRAQSSAGSALKKRFAHAMTSR
eukprot:4938380-Alexandrium_andersonii.AAC.1